MTPANREPADRLAIGAATAVCAITLLVVAGYILNAPILQSFLPDRIGMKLVTATAFAIAAVAIFALSSSSRGAHVISAAGGISVAILGAMTLIQVTTGIDLSIDRMWIAEKPGAVETVHPGRMAANSATAFVAVAVAILLARNRSRIGSVVARLAILVVIAITLQVIVGFAYEAHIVRSAATATPMALPTAINFGLLAFALGRTRRDEWPMALLLSDSEAAKTTRVLLPASLAVIVASGWLRMHGEFAGLYGTATGTALFAIASITAVWVVTLWITTRLSRSEMERARDHEDLRRALTARNAISDASRELEGVYRAIVEQSCALIDVAGAAVATVEHGHVYYQYGAGTARPLSGLRIPVEGALIPAVMGEDRAIVVDDVSKSGFVATVREQMGSVAAGIVPLRTSEKDLGCLIVFAASGEKITPRQLDLVRVLATPSSAAVIHAQQFEERQHLLLEQAGELAALQEQFTAFMANIPAAAFIKDDSGRYVFANPAIKQYLGHDPEEVLGLMDDEFLTASQKAQAAASWFTLRFPINVAGGRRFQGGVAFDVTDQKRAQAEIAQLNASLERRVAERTEQLQRSNHELEAFTYSVSHDLRAPLRAVSGYSSILSEDYAAVLDGEGQRFLATIREEAQRMGALIDDLLSFSRIGRQSISPMTLDVGELARDVFREVERARPDREFDFVCDELPPALADRNTMRQVLMNLLSNAAKYSKPEGTIRIEMGATADSEFNTYWVRDYGVGFDMRYVDKLFGVFQRLHTNEEFEGTGVGLAIVDRIIARHQGRVWAEGKVGEGACFYFTLPAVGSNVFGDDALEDAESSVRS